MKNNRFWIIAFAVLLCVSALAWWFISYGNSGTEKIAKIYKAGQLLYTIDLNKVDESYEITVGDKQYNTILVENGRISITSASCPDQYCVHQGSISGGGLPLVCLPNQLIIKIETTSDDDVDIVSY